MRFHPDDIQQMFVDAGDIALFRGVEVAGAFQHEYVESAMIQGEAPVFTCAESDMTGVAQGELIVVNETRYAIREYKKDGAGFIKLVLEDQEA